MEAFANKVISTSPELEGSIYLARGGLHEHLFGTQPFEGKPIVLYDDLLAETKSVADVRDFHAHYLARAITHFYDKKCLVIITSNFPLLPGIADQLQNADPVGRIKSRLVEMTAGSAQMKLTGPDYRGMIAGKRDADPFGAFDDGRFNFGPDVDNGQNGPPKTLGGMGF